MKKISYFLLLLTGFIALSMLPGCVDDDFDTPDLIVPHVDFQSNTTIFGLKALYPGSGIDSINDDIIIQGIVSANDESGNFYKAIQVQDSTGGIEIQLNRTNLYTEYKVGQRVFVKCKGLFLSNYGGLIQLGYKIDREFIEIPDLYIENYLFKDGLPEQEPEPEVLTMNQFSAGRLSTLVKIEEVHFQEAGQVIANHFSLLSATNRTIVDDDENALVLRTSGYANFIDYVLPKGKGSIVGILSVYNGDYQLFIRDLDDIVAWDTNVGVSNAIIDEPFDSDPPGWTKYSIASNKDWYWSSQYSCMAVSGYGGDAASNDWLISPQINLTDVLDPVLSFRTWTKYLDNGLANPLQVFVSDDYAGSGDPTGATWIPLACILSAANSGSWTGSGDIDLSVYEGGKVYIGFQYRSSGTATNAAANWEVDAFKVIGVSK